MKSSRSFFNRGIFMNYLTRFWPIYTIYFLVLLQIPAQALQYASSPGYALTLRDLLLGYAGLSGVFFNLLYGIACALSVFVYLYNSRAAYFFGGLPVRRRSLMGTGIISGFLFSLVPNLLISLLLLVAEGAYGGVQLALTFQFLLIMELEFLFFFGLAAFCCVLSGSCFASIFLYALFNFLFSAGEYCLQRIFNSFVHGYSASSRVLLFLSPASYLCANGYTSTDYNAALGGFATVKVAFPYLWAIAAVGVLLLILSMGLFRTRNAEAAGDAVAYRGMQRFFRIGMTAVCAVLLGQVIYGLFGNIKSYVLLFFAILLGGFAGYAVAEMVMRKSFRIFRPRMFRTISVLAVCTLCLLACMRFDLFGYERYIPASSDVDTVLISGVAMTDPDDLQQVQQLHEDLVALKGTTWDAETGSSWVYIGYTLKNGTEKERSYSIPLTSEAAQRLDKLLNEPRNILLRCTPACDLSACSISYCTIYFRDEDTTRNVYLDDKAAAALYAACLEDMNAGTLGLDRTYRANSSADSSNCWLDMEFIENGTGTSYYFSTDVMLTSAHTVAYLQQLGYEVLPAPPSDTVPGTVDAMTRKN